MNLKSITTPLAIAAIGLFMVSCGSGSDETATTAQSNVSEGLSGTYSLDANESTINWTGHMLKIGGVSLYKHYGTIDFEKGRVVLEDGQFVDGTFVVDMHTISPEDDGYGEDEGSRRSDLMGHLASDDFFAIADYPTATFEITGTENGKVNGTMTIRGNSNPVVIEDFEIQEEGDNLRIIGTLTVDRQQFDVAFKMPAQDKVLSDDLDLEFDIVLTPTNAGA